MAVRTRTTNATETARKILETGRTTEELLAAAGFALVGISDQIAYLIGMAEAENADHEAWKAANARR